MNVFSTEKYRFTVESWKHYLSHIQEPQSLKGSSPICIKHCIFRNPVIFLNGHGLLPYFPICHKTHTKYASTRRCCCLEFFLHNDLKIILPNCSHKTVNWVILWKTFFACQGNMRMGVNRPALIMYNRWFSPERDKDLLNNEPLIRWVR